MEKEEEAHTGCGSWFLLWEAHMKDNGHEFMDNVSPREPQISEEPLSYTCSPKFA